MSRHKKAHEHDQQDDDEEQNVVPAQNTHTHTHTHTHQDQNVEPVPARRGRIEAAREARQGRQGQERQGKGSQARASVCVPQNVSSSDRMCPLTICVPQNVFSYDRMCFLTIECAQARQRKRKKGSEEQGRGGKAMQTKHHFHCRVSLATQVEACTLNDSILYSIIDSIPYSIIDPIPYSIIDPIPYSTIDYTPCSTKDKHTNPLHKDVSTLDDEAIAPLVSVCNACGVTHVGRRITTGARTQHEDKRVKLKPFSGFGFRTRHGRDGITLCHEHAYMLDVISMHTYSM